VVEIVSTRSRTGVSFPSLNLSRNVVASFLMNNVALLSSLVWWARFVF
jgi:hypothetical protein